MIDVRFNLEAINPSITLLPLLILRFFYILKVLAILH